MNESENTENGTSIGRYVLAGAVLLIAAWFLLHFLVGIVMWLVSVVVVIAAVVAVIWAVRVLL